MIQGNYRRHLDGVNNSDEELEKEDQAKIRLNRIKSAMKDEGAADWSMEEAKVHPKPLLAMPSQFDFENKKEQVDYCK